jgi:hypothetical protein
LVVFDEQDQNENASKETVKTVSRIVQSFEKKSVRNILNLLESGNVVKSIALNHMNRLRGGIYGDVDDISHTLRRSTITYDAFANLVAAEILFSDGTNGSRNTSIHLSKRLDFERQMSAMTLIEVLQRIASSSVLPKDNLGLPLMKTNGKLCVSKGVLVVCGDSEYATYILNLEDQKKIDEVIAAWPSNGKRPRFLEITAQIYSEEDDTNFKEMSAFHNKKSESEKKPKLSGLALLI